MSPATWPRPEPLEERLLVVPAAGRFVDARVRELPSFLAARDLVVVNDAATLPASLAAKTERGEPLEVRLLAHRGDARWRVALLGAGDWRTPTERRPAPPALAAGDRVAFDGSFSGVVESVHPPEGRVADVTFDVRDAALWHAIYRVARPVQYAHVSRPLALWDVQTPYASRPWAAEMPSAGRPLTFALRRALAARGVRVARLTHAAGLSSIGDAAIDAHLPFPERYDVPADTVRAIAEAHAGGGRVVAVGTTVVRALEGAAAANGGAPVAGEGETDLVIGAGHTRRVVDAIFTGMHDPGTSHFALLESFAPRARLVAAIEHAERTGYASHEFGDSMLLSS